MLPSTLEYSFQLILLLLCTVSTPADRRPLAATASTQPSPPPHTSSCSVDLRFARSRQIPAASQSYFESLLCPPCLQYISSLPAPPATVYSCSQQQQHEQRQHEQHQDEYQQHEQQQHEQQHQQHTQLLRLLLCRQT